MFVLLLCDSPNVGISASLPGIEGAEGFRAIFYAEEGAQTPVAFAFGGAFDYGTGDNEIGRGMQSIDIEQLYTAQRTNFNASKWNSVYGGDAVQPSALTAHFIIKA